VLGEAGTAKNLVVMDDATRFQLLGTYTTPRCRYGKTVFCEEPWFLEGQAWATRFAGQATATIPCL
jgi:hypothetical protein